MKKIDVAKTLLMTLAAVVATALLYFFLVKSLPKTYEVVAVIDGDTIEVSYDGKNERVRLIGIDSPEMSDDNERLACLAEKSKEYLSNKINGREVELKAEQLQGDKDKYNRLLRYIYLDNESINREILLNGYAYEYTYGEGYEFQKEYKEAADTAKNAKKGIWSDELCPEKSADPTPSEDPVIESESPPSVEPQQACDIKGNINASGDKIYHMPGQEYYGSTIIDTSKGERMFCTESEAINAGWRKSKV